MNIRVARLAVALTVALLPLTLAGQAQQTPAQTKSWADEVVAK
jgi:hypothetical protein